MDPVTLHFNVFQAGSPVRKSLQVEDPRGTTILALKQQLFSDDLKACKSVRFIAGGKILDDSAAVDSCKLGSVAHIHVSVSDAGVRSRTQSEESGASTTSAAEAKASGAPSHESSDPIVGWTFIIGAALFLGTGAMLFVALRKRYQFTMHTSQLLFICAAVWVYLLLCHGFPALVQTLSKLGNAPRTAAPKNSPPQNVVAASIATPVGTLDEVPSASSSASPATAASSPGLSLMTPTLPPGDAVAAASVLTQRR